VGSRGDIYNYNYFDPKNNALMGVSIFQFSDGMRSLIRRSYAERATYAGSPGEPNAWHAQQVWIREFAASGDPRQFHTQAQADLSLEPPSYFSTREPEPEFMSYSQLRDYIGQLRTSGFDVVAPQVALERKVSFPFVTLIMTLIAVPFAVTAGRRGAMYGIGVGIVIAISYWVAFSVLAAWAPNLLFGAGAAYLLLTVRT
jgi:lipopolysaccharide export LptBFGC system permease protein LptF